MNSFLQYLIIGLLLIISFYGFSQERYLITQRFDKQAIPPIPNYESSANWSALPFKKDFADSLPKNKLNLKENQANAKADVFYLHPTIYTKEPKDQYLWNARIDDKDLNIEIDEKPVLNQATAFNGSCKVYAPRYRQSHYSVFMTKDTASARLSMDVAYEDVKAAFEYYLKNYNTGRPIIIAAHSQGTVHAARLLKEFFDGKELQKLLITAYLVGMPVNDSKFSKIKVSTKPDAVGGYTCWNTFDDEYIPDYYANGLNKAVSINPVNWTESKEFNDKKEHKGMVGQGFTLQENCVEARNNTGLLWIKKPFITGRAFIKFKIWHFADVNLFWLDIRENVALRINSYFLKLND